MTLTLLTAYNAPYLAALTFVLLTGIAELIALLCGHSLSSAMDTPDLPEGLTGEALDWLNIGRIPLLSHEVRRWGRMSTGKKTGMHSPDVWRLNSRKPS
ncbi:YqiJ family protein [Escherichia coli]|uniref:OB-fold-containig protein n=1 Tax=Escherichia coli TaxID=562 RepID=UPI000B077C2E|nr:OB-fold-containig protein [Escherichia coli]MCK2382682.1 YqiJ family protein [Escherichia coli]MCP3458162.1 YqiJ family protein [Escherichia coli]MCS1026185.1 YqiJ family protein [Escherichia coli]MCY6557825.1 DUF1449 family protein [Escherichia coli]MDF8947152.1 DUF1449 family protein [Escherichia coli]